MDKPLGTDYPNQSVDTMDQYLANPTYQEMRFQTLYSWLRENSKWDMIGDFIIMKHALRIMKDTHNITYPRSQLNRAWRMTEEYKTEKQLPKEFERFIKLEKKEMSEAQKKNIKKLVEANQKRLANKKG